MPRSAQSGMTERGKQVREALLSIDGVLESDSIFSDDMAYWVNGKEIAHFHGQDSLELRLTRPVIRELRDQLKAEPQVKLRNASSDWLIMSFASAADVGLIARHQACRLSHRQRASNWRACADSIERTQRARPWGRARAWGRLRN